MSNTLVNTESVEPTPTVEQLRKSGYKVRVTHFRQSLFDGKLWNRNLFEGNPHLISTRGGKTVVEITTPNLENVKGEAVCSKNDTFNRKTGLYTAISRALQSLN